MFRRGTFWLAIAIGTGAALAARGDELPFEPGEEIRLKVRYLKMNVGDVHLRVGTPAQDGADVWPLELKGRTRGLFDSMYSVEEAFVSHLDAATGTTLGSDRRTNVDGELQTEVVRYDGTKAKVRRTKKGQTREETKNVLPGAHDVLSAVFHLRSLPLANGDRFEIPVFTGKKSWKLTGVVLGREPVELGDRTFDTVKVRCRTHFDGKFASDRDLTVWLTNDERRIPVRADADFMVGTMRATLAEYRQGTLARR